MVVTTGSNLEKNLQELLSLLRGTVCWSVIAGEGTGSQVKLDFGAKLPRTVPVRNPTLRTDQRDYEGEFDIFVECAWRLEHNGEVLCGSGETNRNDGSMRSGLSRLNGRTVINVQAAVPIPDLVIEFTGELALKIFCDQTELENGGDNYSVRSGDTILVVGARGHISREARASD